MNKVMLTQNELRNIKPGEAITLGAILAIMAIAIVTVAVYKLFTSSEAVIKLPGGYQFTWG